MKYLTNFNTLQEYEDSLIIDIPNVSYIIEQKIVKYTEESIIPNKYIVYKSTNGEIINPHQIDAFGSQIVSNKYNNFGLISFNAPVTNIGHEAFYDCSSLVAISIPNSVTSIGNYAFSDCSSLTSIAIPNSVTNIGSYAFYKCSSLTSVTIPNSVTSIKNNTFGSCDGLTSVTIPNSVTSIGYEVFIDCSSLTSITIPNSVTSIGRSSFDGCTSLTTITCGATIPPTLSSYNKLSNVTAVYVPAESVDAYKVATNWSYYADKIQPIQ